MLAKMIWMYVQGPLPNQPPTPRPGHISRYKIIHSAPIARFAPNAILYHTSVDRQMLEGMTTQAKEQHRATIDVTAENQS